MNGADAVAKCLELQGVKTVFGYPGVAICPVYDSLMNTDIHPVLVRSEANARHPEWRAFPANRAYASAQAVRALPT